MGFTTQTEANLLTSVTLFGATRYLRLIQWSGSAASWVATDLNEDGSLPATMAEVSTGGYAVHTVPASEWSTPNQAAPTTIQWPKTGTTGVTYTPSGGATWKVCAYAWTTNTNPVTSANVIASGVMVDSTGAACLLTVDATHPLTINDTYPIIERLGDPPPGVDPT